VGLLDDERKEWRNREVTSVMSRFKAVFIAPRDISLSSTISGIIEEERCERVMMVIK
jgi:hypothetical protein